MRVVRIDARRGLALCADGDGSRSTVEIGLVDALTAGDAVLVHAGVALQVLEPDAVAGDGVLPAGRA